MTNDKIIEPKKQGSLVAVSRELLIQAIDTIGYYAGICGEDDQDTPAKQAQAVLRTALEQSAVEPVYWNAVLDPEQVPQQLNKKLHRCGFRHKRDAKAFIETEFDFSGWRYTLVPLYTTPQAQQPQLLTDEEIKDSIRHLYQDATALQMSMDITLHEFRAIEQAVHRKMGVGK